MARNELSIEQARKLIETWQGQYEDYEYSQRLASRFQVAGQAAVMRMWETGTNEKGKPLSTFELAALAERWAQIFGNLPACDDDAALGVAADLPEADAAEDAILSPRGTARLAGVTLSDLERQLHDGTFPRPCRLSRRRVGWRVRQIKDWANRARAQHHREPCTT
jgi:predicted DNA-binding transcriptional regulator AlpA